MSALLSPGPRGLKGPPPLPAHTRCCALLRVVLLLGLWLVMTACAAATAGLLALFWVGQLHVLRALC